MLLPAKASRVPRKPLLAARPPPLLWHQRLGSSPWVKEPGEASASGRARGPVCRSRRNPSGLGAVRPGTPRLGSTAHRYRARACEGCRGEGAQLAAPSDREGATASAERGTAVATALLAEGVEQVVEQVVAHGAEETRLLAKLRRDPYPWPPWAEIRAASILVNSYGEAVRVTLEPGRSQGKQPDFASSCPTRKDGLSIEFKAVGLSDREADYCTS